jgi:hypothetical protein
MQLDTLAHTLQVIIAPVVMVTACAIFLGGLLSRYAAINDRLRLMARERLDLLRLPDETPFSRERIEEIDNQIPLLLKHHRQAHDSVLVVYVATAIFLLDMFVIALGTVMYTDWVGAAILVLFLAGMAALFVGAALMVLEVRTSHEAVHYEVMRALKIIPSERK